VTEPRPLVVVGDALLDRDVEGRVRRLAPDAPVPVVDQTGVRVRPGGAGLAAALAVADGRPVTLVTALAADAAAQELRAALDAAGVSIVDLALDGTTPEKIRITTGGRSLLRLDRGGEDVVVGPMSATAREAIGWAAGVLVADYGRGVAAQPSVREALAWAAEIVPIVWDPHPRGPAPVPGVRMVTPNLAEAIALEPEPAGEDARAIGARAAALARRWEATQVCVTCGARGAVLAGPEGAGPAPLIPARAVEGGDPCGAGDRFASRLAGALADGIDGRDAVARAVDAATSFVAAGGAMAAELDRRPAGNGPAAELIARVRAQGGTVVATGGCFDLLHPGHVRTLEAARALGDCLVVCLNSDASVRRLKGSGRPVVGEDDRAAVLRALRCVDEVVVFDEDTPSDLLARLRPDVWVKGGDYRPEDLPEAEVVAGWGGRVAVVPFLEGRSSTRLIKEVSAREL
jgi:rfaE bifunctional protein nucleotidyltransferase chain/domain/rfaE bifunctional protein kinase chain/domain